MPERVITPHSGLDEFKDAIGSLLRDFRQSTSLAWRILLRDTRATYRQSLLGYFWLFLPPLATVLVWVFLNSSNLVSVDSGDVPYFLFVITGTVLWTAFNSAVMAMQELFGSARPILSKVNFPHEALIFAAMGKGLMNSCLPALMIIPVLYMYDIQIGFGTLKFLAGFMVIVTLGCSVGLVFVPLGALYGDVSRAIQLALRFGFFLTPVIYALPDSGINRTLLLLNPVTTPLVSSRSWLIGEKDTFPDEVTLIFFASLLLLFMAILAFKVAMPRIIERLNA